MKMALKARKTCGFESCGRRRYFTEQQLRVKATDSNDRGPALGLYHATSCVAFQSFFCYGLRWMRPQTTQAWP